MIITNREKPLQESEVIEAGLFEPNGHEDNLQQYIKVILSNETSMHQLESTLSIIFQISFGTFKVTVYIIHSKRRFMQIKFHSTLNIVHFIFYYCFTL